MTRPLKPHLDPQSQIRRYQRNQVPSIHGERAPTRIFTVGTANPQQRHPSMALAGLSTLLEHTKPEGKWSVFPCRHPDHFFNTLYNTLPPKSPIIAVAGANTPAMALVFTDMTCLLTQRSRSGLRIYPTILYFRTRDSYWTAKFLLGRGKKATPQFRITTIPHGTHSPQKNDDRTHYLYTQNSLLLPPGKKSTSQNNDKKWEDWASIIRNDIDYYNDIFTQLEGHAIWPENQTTPSFTQKKQTLEKPSIWPENLPLKGPSQEVNKRRQTSFEQVGQWIYALQSLYNYPPKDILVRQSNKTTQSIEVLFLPPGTPLQRDGAQTQAQAKYTTLSKHNGTLSNALPDYLKTSILTNTECHPGLRYYHDETGSWASEWEFAKGYCNTPLTGHVALEIFAKYGAPTPEHKLLWDPIFKSL